MTPYNDIDVFVEDKTYVGVYEKLINRALAGRARVQKVIPLGPRKDVLDAAMNDNVARGRPRLYIVDGDLDLIAHFRQRRARHLYRLRVYSLENLLLESKALEAYCGFACPSRTADDACKAVDLEFFLQQIEQLASIYIVTLAIARRLDLRDGAFGMDIKAIFALKDGKHSHVDRRRLFSKLRILIKRIIELKSLGEFRSAKKDVLAAIDLRRFNGIDYIPGKMLLWYLNERVGGAKGASLQQSVIASYLADHCTLARDGLLVRRLRQVARNKPAGEDP
jgi:hypothetical protein